MKNLPALKCAVFACTLASAGFTLAGEEAADDAAHPSQHPVWYKLLHYERDFTSRSGVRSAIHSNDFFIAADGKTDPSAEFEATLTAFSLPVDGDADRHAQCRFPARYLWVKQHPQWSDAFTEVQCPSFNKWALDNSVRSISIVYATGYLANPASYYGHTLLKLNSANGPGTNRLLDVSVNYGAIIPGSEDPFTYVIKGVFGGYDGGFSQIGYYYHTHNYGEIELRNLWEYELDLEKEEVALVVAHAWEVLGKKYTYFFLRKNCAYRMAEILEIVEGVHFIPDNPVFTIPQSLMQNIGKATRNGQPLVRSVRFHPSRQSRLYEKFAALSTIEKDVVYAITEDIGSLESDTYRSMPIESRQIILDTLLDYYQFAKTSQALDEQEAATRYAQVLAERFALPPGGRSATPSEPAPPHEDRASSMVRAGPAFNQTLGNGLLLRLRPAYYDVLDAGPTHVSNSVLAMGEMKFFVRNGNLDIRSLDLVRIERVNSSITGLPGDDGNAWKFRLGIEQQNLSCLDCLVARLEGDIGRAARPHPKVLTGIFLGGGLQNNRDDSGNVFVRASVFSYIRPTARLGLRVLAEFPKHIDGSADENRHLTLESRYELDTNIDLRFQYEKWKAEEYTVTMGWYF